MPNLTGWLIEIGLCEAAGMGMVPVAWSTIEAWQRLTGVSLSPWEAKLLHHLSTEYLAEGRRAESENCPAPWRSGVTQTEREIEQARLEMVLG